MTAPHIPARRATARRPRRIAVVTGTRAEYGLLTTALAAIHAEPRLRLQLVVTGMHLLPEFGLTVDTIAADGWEIAARVPMQAGTDDPLDQAQGLAAGVAGIARFLSAAATDVVVVLGDRIEAMAGALAALTTGRALAHIHGGDVAPGDFDEALRHAITKLAHIHLPATRAAARRIGRMGEPAAQVHVVGATGLDRIRELVGDGAHVLTSQRDAAALVVFHASGRPPAVEGRAMTHVLNAVAAQGLRRIILYPNTDRGHRGVLAAIDRHARDAGPGAVEVHRSLPRDEYLRRLMRVRVLVGNSSSGVIEAPLAGTPSVNVGARQAGREPGGPTVVHSGETPASIRAALRRALRCRARPLQRTVYGDGQAGRRIARILAALDLTPELLKKRLSF